MAAREPIFRFGPDHRGVSGPEARRAGDFSFRMPMQSHRGHAATRSGGADDRRDHRQHENGRSPRNSNARPQDRHRQLPRNAKREAYLRGRGARRNFTSTSSRALLQAKRDSTPEQMEGMNDGGSRFRDVAQLTDSESEDVETSAPTADDSEGRNDEDIDGPVAKKPRTTLPHTISKWSNPDPYTSLPPPSEANGKKMDMVKLIRKAKAEEVMSKSVLAQTDEFISFGMAFEVEDKRANDKASRDDGQCLEFSSDSQSDYLDSLQLSQRTRSGASLPQKPAFVDLTLPTKAHGLPPPQDPLPSLPSTLAVPQRISSWPPVALLIPQDALKSSNPVQQTGRKRTLVEYSEDIEPVEFSRDQDAIRKKQLLLDRSIVPKWRSRSGVNPCPWMRNDYSPDISPAERFHEEICDFYDFLKPRRAENSLREELVEDLQSCLDFKRPGCEVRFFGSFAAGLYLPEGDMDLVVFTPQFVATGIPDSQLLKYSGLRKLADILLREGIAKAGSITVIAKARVPLIKYVDRKTRLRVDVSFDNNSGVRANRTYKDWANLYPAMPIMVTMIKQFLLMRDMNEVHTGGLGGFSITCIVVSFLQHDPRLLAAGRGSLPHLGQLFISLLDFWGHFNLDKTGVELNPPRYFDKTSDPRIRINPNQPPLPKLSIIDPNNPENDISGGSTQVSQIFGAFATACHVLKARLSKVHLDRASGNAGSILGCLFAGDYGTFQEQRAHLERLYRPPPDDKGSDYDDERDEQRN